MKQVFIFLKKKKCRHSRNNLIKHWVKMVTNQVTHYMPVKFLLGTYRRLQLLISYRVHISNMVTHARWNDRVRGPKDLATMTDFIFLVGKDNSYERMHLRFFFSNPHLTPVNLKTEQIKRDNFWVWTFTTILVKIFFANYLSPNWDYDSHFEVLNMSKY